MNTWTRTNRALALSPAGVLAGPASHCRFPLAVVSAGHPIPTSPTPVPSHRPAPCHTVPARPINVFMPTSDIPLTPLSQCQPSLLRRSQPPLAAIPPCIASVLPPPPPRSHPSYHLLKNRLPFRTVGCALSNHAAKETSTLHAPCYPPLVASAPVSPPAAAIPRNERASAHHHRPTPYPKGVEAHPLGQ